MAGRENPKIYKGFMIQLDLEKMAFKRESDKDWMKLPPPDFVALTQVKVKHAIYGRFTGSIHSYKKIAVYIKAGKLNILAYRGRRSDAEKIGKEISEFLQVRLKDLIPRDAEGNITDDDGIRLMDQPGCMVIVIMVMLVFLLILLSAG